MSRKFRFSDDAQSPEKADSTYDSTASKPRKQRRLEHDDSKPAVAANDTAPPAHIGADGASNTPVGNASFSDNSAIGGENQSGIAGFQYGVANVLRTISPDETPDRNAAVSTTRFAFEAGATAFSKMTAAPKSKRKSKLKEKDSRLKFGQEDSKGEDKAEDESRDADENEAAQDESESIETDNDNVEDVGDDTEKPTQQPEADAQGDDPETSDTQPDPADSDSSVVGESGDDSTADSGNPSSSGSASGKPGSKLKFDKEGKEIGKLEKTDENLGKKLDKAREKLPAKKTKKKQLVFDEKKGKSVSKLTHEKEAIPIGEAKWNKPKDKSSIAKTGSVVSSMALTKVHAKLHQVEHQNVGVKTAHQAELLAESGYRGAKRSVRSAYRFHKNRHYRRVSKLEQKSIKNRMRLDYKKTLRDNPKLKSNPLSRMMQKRAIKRKYAKAMRDAKKTAAATKKTVGITAKAFKLVTAILRKNPVFLVKAGLLALVVFLILSLLTMCVGMFSGGSAFVGAVTYAADVEDIDDATILYTELETDLRVYIEEIETNHPGYDEYRLNIGSIGHDPFALMAFLTAVYQDFTFAEVEAAIRAIFDAQYTLDLVPEVEIRYREEERTGTGSWTDDEGNSHSYEYTYTVIVEYEWHILNVTLTSRPFADVLAEMMDDDQSEHYTVLMYSKGARQFVGNPFDFDWLPFVSSYYGYRIHPINNVKQFHWGLDIGQPEGTPLHSGFTGTVVAVGYQPDGYGNFVVVEDVDGNQARYAHCHQVFVTQGQSVERGDIIATVGNTGASTGAHLHIEISIEGRRVNPLFFIEFR